MVGVIYADRRCPDLHLSFSGTELYMILREMHRPSVLRAGHFYPFEGSALYYQKFLASFQNLLDMILPPPPPLEVSAPPLGSQTSEHFSKSNLYTAAWTPGH